MKSNENNNVIQENLFGEQNQHSLEEEWQDMPEFIQKDKQPVQKIVINFESFKDVDLFAELIDQNLTKKTNSIWFPYKKKQNMKKWMYEDES